jgi:hypothetical protein
MKLNTLPVVAALAVAGLAAAPSALACESCTTDAQNHNVCWWSGDYGYASCWSGTDGNFTACYADGACGSGPGGDGGGGYFDPGPFFCDGWGRCLS